MRDIDVVGKYSLSSLHYKVLATSMLYRISNLPLYKSCIKNPTIVRTDITFSPTLFLGFSDPATVMAES